MRYSAFLGSSFRLPALLSLASLTCFVTNLSHGESVEYSGGSTALNFGSANVCPAGQSSPSPCSNTLTLSYSIAANTPSAASQF